MICPLFLLRMIDQCIINYDNIIVMGDLNFDNIIVMGDLNFDNIIVMGDLNFDMLSDTKCQTLKDLCDVLDFSQLVLKPTCFMKNCIPSLVDDQIRKINVLIYKIVLLVLVTVIT
jgi:hypothetical protein